MCAAVSKIRTCLPSLLCILQGGFQCRLGTACGRGERTGQCTAAVAKVLQQESQRPGMLSQSRIFQEAMFLYKISMYTTHLLFSKRRNCSPHAFCQSSCTTAYRLHGQHQHYVPHFSKRSMLSEHDPELDVDTKNPHVVLVMTENLDL